MEALVLMHQDRVFAVLRRCVPPDEVEDLAQEAFLRAFRRLDRFRGDAAFGTWLFSIVRNLLIDRHRSRGRAPEQVALCGDGDDPGEAPGVVLRDPGPGPDELFERQTLDARLGRALGRLGAKDRLAVVLCDQEGMSAAEAASIIGGSPGALRIRLMRARGRLRTWLQEGAEA